MAFTDTWDLPPRQGTGAAGAEEALELGCGRLPTSVVPMELGEQKRGPQAPRAQITEMVEPLVPCSLRAIAKALVAGTRRIFLTGLPRRPK